MATALVYDSQSVGNSSSRQELQRPLRRVIEGIRLSNSFLLFGKSNTGFLPKTEVAEAPRLMEKSAREIQRVMDSAPASVDVHRMRLRTPL